MTSIKRLIQITVAAGALLAVPASASASGGFAADEYAATVSGSGNTLVMHVGGSGPDANTYYYCYSTNSTTTMNGPVSALSTGALVEPGTQCEMNGCELTFRPGEEEVDLGPPGCGPIRFGTSLCPMGLGPQTDLTAEYDGPYIDLNTSAMAIRPTPSSCGEKGEEVPAQLSLKYTLSATNESDEEIDVSSYASDVPDGIFINTEPGENVGLNAQGYPVEVRGERGDEGVIELFEDPNTEWGDTSCESADLTTSLAEVATSFKLDGEFGGCSMHGIGEATIKMNSCSYAFEEFIEDRQSPFEVYGSGIVCESEGDAIVISAPGCQVRLPAQLWESEGLTELENQGLGKDATVDVHLPGSGMSYTTKGWTCAFAGLPSSSEEGAMSADLTLSGVYSG